MKRALTILPVAALVLSACGSDDGGIETEGAWARPTAEGQTAGAIYLDITADASDRLVAASVPASVAATTEVHEVVRAEPSESDDDGESDMDHDEMSDDGETDMDHDEMSDDSQTDMDHGEMSDDSQTDMGEMDPQMRMQELVDGLPLPAGETVSLEPGGYHVMLLDLAEPLAIGDEIELTLDFENAADLTLTVEVAESAP